MNFAEIDAGRDIPKDINVIVEIPTQGDPVKYEVDKSTGAICVDRFMSTAMHYPCNYGYMPKTLSQDGDPADILVISPFPLLTGSLIRCRPVGVLKMEDESGIDAKILAVPVPKLSPLYEKIQDINDVCPQLLKTISHFFEHYKDLEKGKWVKVSGWQGVAEAEAEIMESVERYQNNQDKGN
jgi:inorganic pyrophosphatase